MRALLLFVAVALLATGCDSLPAADPGDLAATLAAVEDVDTFTAALAAAGLLDGLTADGPVTVLAPTDDAFLYLGAEARQALLAPANRPLLVQLLRAHIVRGRLDPDALADGARLETLDGHRLVVRREAGAVFVGGARIDLLRRRDVADGVLLPIDAVLEDALDTPGRLLLSPTFQTFVRLAAEAGTLPSLGGPVTVLAPIDDAFRQLGAGEALLNEPGNTDVRARLVGGLVVDGLVRLEDVASGTVLTARDGTPLPVTRDGGALFVGGQRVIAEATETATGRIYALQSLPLDGLTLWDRIRIAPDLLTFRTALRARPDLVARLSTEALTVLAPLTSAFDPVNLDTDVRVALDQPANAVLFDRLVRTHVLVGRYDVPTLDTIGRVTTANGLSLSVVRLGSFLIVQDRILTEKIEQARNGVLYRVAAVVFPPSDAFDTALLAGYTRHADALRVAGLEAVVRSSDPVTVFAIENAVYVSTPGLDMRPDLARILLYHTASGRIAPLVPGVTFEALSGHTRRIVASNGTLVLEGSGGVERTHEALNGLVYSVRGVGSPSGTRG